MSVHFYAFFFHIEMLKQNDFKFWKFDPIKANCVGEYKESVLITVLCLFYGICLHVLLSYSNAFHFLAFFNAYCHIACLPVQL